MENSNCPLSKYEYATVMIVTALLSKESVKNEVDRGMIVITGMKLAAEILKQVELNKHLYD